MSSGKLQVVRKKACGLDLQLAGSSSNVKELQHCKGHESSVLQVICIISFFSSLVEFLLLHIEAFVFFSSNFLVRNIMNEMQHEHGSSNILCNPMVVG
jgi:hypothetical protein